MSPPMPRRMDPKIWRACAGTADAVQIPKLHSSVYYFPQGHVEHTCASPLLFRQPVIPCVVSALDLLADPLTDEVFAKFLLTPLADCRLRDTPSDAGEYNDGDRVVSFTKILTPSDANSSRFSVPRGYAKSIFPALENQPCQVLSITDVQGVVWKFFHIYSWTVRRHQFTAGWSEFVKRKKLVAGDSVVFMKNSNGNIFVGIRRDKNFAAAAMVQKKDEVEENQNAEEEGFSGSRKRGKVTAKAVAEAAELAARNMAFEVVYYPGTGGWNFVVEANVVEEAMKIAWKPRMRVKIAVDVDDSPRMRSFRGTVSSVSAPHSSPWRMLQVTWDIPGVLQNARQVSPWEVELVSDTHALHQAFPHTYTVTKKRLPLRAESSEDRAMMVMKDVPPTVSATISTDKLRQLLLQEGVNEVVIRESEDIMRTEFFHLHKHNVALKHKQLLLMDHLEAENDNSTELKIGNSLSDDLSPNRHTSLNSFGTDFAGVHYCNTAKVGCGSIRLFGKMIQPVMSDLHDSGCLGDCGRKDSNETEGTDS